jgi:methyl-accepting chemotaxis protein
MVSERQVRGDGGRRILGGAGQVAGLIGMVVCLLSMVGAVLGRGWAVDAVDDVATDIDSQVARAEPMLATGADKIGQVSGIVDSIVVAAEAVAADSNPSPSLIDDLRDKVADLEARYLELRAQYAQLREQIVSASNLLTTLDRLAPTLSLPQGPGETLQEIDGSIQEIDARMAEIISFLASNPLQSAVREWASSIAERVSGVAERVDRVEAAIAQVQPRLTALRADLAAKADSTANLITLGAFGVVLVLLYLTLLHAVLFVHGGEVRRGNAVAAPTPVAQAPAAPKAPPA